MTVWMYLLDPKDHFLKVLCYYLKFWQKYKGVLPWLQKHYRHTHRQTNRDWRNLYKITSSAQLEISPVSFKFSEQEKFDD